MNREKVSVGTLHGAGERGSDSKNGWCTPRQTASKNDRFNFTFVIFPQCPTEHRWVESDWTLPQDSGSLTESHPGWCDVGAARPSLYLSPGRFKTDLCHWLVDGGRLPGLPLLKTTSIRSIAGSMRRR